MSLFTLAIILLCCLALGAREPFLFLVAFALLVWIFLALIVRVFRRMVGLTGPARPPGTNLARGRPCPDERCGRVNRVQARFCGQCGRRLA